MRAAARLRQLAREGRNSMSPLVAIVLRAVADFCREHKIAESRVRVEFDEGQVLVSWEEIKRRTHAPDYRSVLWDGRKYEFTPNQAAVVAQLWAAWENGTPAVSQDALLETADSQSNRLRDVFKNHPAWGTFIVPGESKGTSRLAV